MEKKTKKSKQFLTNIKLISNISNQFLLNQITPQILGFFDGLTQKNIKPERIGNSYLSFEKLFKSPQYSIYSKIWADFGSDYSRLFMELRVENISLNFCHFHEIKREIFHESMDFNEECESTLKNMWVEIIKKLKYTKNNVLNWYFNEYPIEFVFETGSSETDLIFIQTLINGFDSLGNKDIPILLRIDHYNKLDFIQWMSIALFAPRFSCWFVFPKCFWKHNNTEHCRDYDRLLPLIQSKPVKIHQIIAEYSKFQFFFPEQFQNVDSQIQQKEIVYALNHIVETERVDFKQTIDLSIDKMKYEFTKDCIALLNSCDNEEGMYNKAFLIYGVEEMIDGYYICHPFEDIKNYEKKLKDLIENNIAPVPNYNFYPINLKELNKMKKNHNLQKKYQFHKESNKKGYILIVVLKRRPMMIYEVSRDVNYRANFSLKKGDSWYRTGERRIKQIDEKRRQDLRIH